MSEHDAGRRGVPAPRPGRLARTPGPAGDGAGEDVDWVRLARELMGALNASHDIEFQCATEGLSIVDAVHDVVVDLMADWRMLAEHEPGVEPPEPSELLADGRTSVIRKLARRARRATIHANIATKLRLVLPADDALDEICTRDELAVFLTRFYKALEDQPEARLLVYLVVSKGVHYKHTRVLAALIGCSETHVNNMKRRIKRLARQVMDDLLFAPRIVETEVSDDR